MKTEIDKIFDQTLDKVVPYTWTTLDYEQLSEIKQHFAEALIRECAAIALREDHEPSECILSHFGVE